MLYRYVKGKEMRAFSYAAATAAAAKMFAMSNTRPQQQSSQLPSHLIYNSNNTYGTASKPIPNHIKGLFPLLPCTLFKMRSMTQ